MTYDATRLLGIDVLRQFIVCINCNNIEMPVKWLLFILINW